MDPSEFGKLFRLFLGLPSHRHPRHHDEDAGDKEHDDPRDQVMPRDDRGDRNFTVLTDPLEIHRFFEQQMDDMLRSFGQGFGGLGRGGGAIRMEPEEEEGAVGSARDFMLKDEGQPRVDTDLDSNQVDMGELETLMRRKDTRRGEEDDVGRGRRNLFGGLMGDGGLFGGAQSGGVSIFGGLGGDNGGNNTFMGSFGTSVVEKTVTLPGGGVETSRTVRNSDGTEVITVTRQVGDQAHQQTTITDREGNTSTVNKFTNVEEGGLTQWGGEKAEEGWEVQPSPREEMMSPPADQLYGSLWNKFWGN